MHLGYAFAPEISRRPLYHDPAVDPTKDHGDRRDADRLDGHYRGYDRGAGDAGRRAHRRTDLQLHAGLWRPGAGEYPLAGAGAFDTPDHHREAPLPGR